MHVLALILVLCSLITVSADKEVESPVQSIDGHQNEAKLVRVKRSDRVKRHLQDLEAELTRVKRTKRHSAQDLNNMLPEPELKREKRMKRDSENEPHLLREKRFRRDIENTFGHDIRQAEPALTRVKRGKRDVDINRAAVEHRINDLKKANEADRAKRMSLKKDLSKKHPGLNDNKHSHTKYRRLTREAKQLNDATRDILEKIEKRSVALAKGNMRAHGKPQNKKRFNKRSAKSYLPSTSFHKKHADRLKELEHKLNINFEHGLDTLGHINKKYAMSRDLNQKHRRLSAKKSLGHKRSKKSIK